MAYASTGQCGLTLQAASQPPAVAQIEPLFNPAPAPSTRTAVAKHREVVRRCLQGRYRPLFGNALWLEYEDVLGRDLWTDATTPAERQQVLAALVQAGRWVSVYFGWRPNLPDEGDNHLIELAVAGNAAAIVTHNVRDVARGELLWKSLRVLTPALCLEEFT